MLFELMFCLFYNLSLLLENSFEYGFDCTNQDNHKPLIIQELENLPQECLCQINPLHLRPSPREQTALVERWIFVKALAVSYLCQFNQVLGFVVYICSFTNTPKFLLTC